MPHVNREQRARLHLIGQPIANGPGELSFQITDLIMGYHRLHGVSSGTLAGVLGALELTKGEYVRRVQYPYETHRRQENGDAFDPVVIAAANR